MSEDRLILVDYCDDIRHEVGFKYSLMGCYASELIVDDIPAILPKLCASITAITPLDKPFKNIVFRAYLNDDLLTESSVPPENLSKSFDEIRNDGMDYTKMVLKVQMAFVPLIIQNESILRVEAETEDGIIKGSRLKLRKKPSQS